MANSVSIIYIDIINRIFIEFIESESTTELDHRFVCNAN